MDKTRQGTSSETTPSGNMPSGDMPSKTTVSDTAHRHMLSRPHRGRMGQTLIYLGKLLRMFLYQNDWKVIPMSALVAGLVAIVIRRTMFVNMEGTLTGSFALACVAIWNGCFNSIQVVCRERDIIKREHRSGMHISAYMSAHALYQALLCVVQTIITLFVCTHMKIKFPVEGVFTSSMILEIGLSIFLITYGADMMSLFLSCVTHSTTTAMTLMPFVLIFQLVFSGGIFSLPRWADGLTKVTISNYGLKVIASQADYNNLPMDSGWNTLAKMKNEEITLTVTVGQVLDYLSDRDNASVAEFRDTEIKTSLSPVPVTTGELIDLLASDPEVAANRGQELTITTTVGELIRAMGEEEVKASIRQRTAAANMVDQYEKTVANIGGYWMRLVLFSIVFFGLSVFVMEFIDRDHR